MNGVLMAKYDVKDWRLALTMEEMVECGLKPNHLNGVRKNGEIRKEYWRSSRVTKRDRKYNGR